MTSTCPECDQPIHLVDGRPPPSGQGVVFYCVPCGHAIPAHEALQAGVPGRWEPANAAALVTMERRRQVAEEGFDATHDAKLPKGSLAWMGFALVDRATSGQNLNIPPPVWPKEARGRWPQDKSPLRMLVIAGALLLAEIDKRLAAGERL